MSAASGAQRIAEVFAQARRERRAALMPYLVLGHPTPDESLEMVDAAIAGGADMLELGVPFSDPLADGPVIQQATQLALQRGISVARCLALVAELRQRGATLPMVLMGYINPILAYGEAAFCSACREAGVDGLIVADMPPEEGEVLDTRCRENGLALIFLLAPTSSPERVRMVCERSQGFVYLVSVTGITGARDRLSPDLAAFVSRVRQGTDRPLAVGFGISNPEQAAEVAKIADGVIVGSALVDLAGRANGHALVRQATRRLRSAVHRG